jgi:hypothetical protein
LGAIGLGGDVTKTEEMNRRLAGWLKRQLPTLGLEKTADSRRRQGQRWHLATLLRAAVVALMCGRKSLREVEEVTEDLSPAMRGLLGLPRRVADTTLRDVLVKLCPSELRGRLHELVRAAQRAKALAPMYFPFGVVAMDGKATALPAWDDRYAGRTLHEETGRAYGLLRTVTCALVSAMGRPCVDAIPLLAGENEVGAFQRCFASLLSNFGHLFRLVTYDAGGTSEANAKAVVDAGKDYLLRLRNELSFITKSAMALLSGLDTQAALAHTEDVISKRGDKVVVRRVYLCHARSWGVYAIWRHTQTFVRVQSQLIQGRNILSEENRFYGSSMAMAALTPDQWLSLVRNHWGVEVCHNVFDSIFKEDDKPWIRTSPSGMLAVLLLRRIAYTLLTLFKHRTLRADENRQQSWRRLFTRLYNALISATDRQVAELRDRKAVAAAS